MSEHDEPVAWIDKHGNIDTGWDAILDSEGWTPLYTHPAQWIGLTEDEVRKSLGADEKYWAESKLWIVSLARAIELALKKKNT